MIKKNAKDHFFLVIVKIGCLFVWYWVHLKEK